MCLSVSYSHCMFTCVCSFPNLTLYHCRSLFGISFFDFYSPLNLARFNEGNSPDIYLNPGADSWHALKSRSWHRKCTEIQELTPDMHSNQGVDTRHADKLSKFTEDMHSNQGNLHGACTWIKEFPPDLYSNQEVDSGYALNYRSVYRTCTKIKELTTDTQSYQNVDTGHAPK